jgi:hypothetical protein
MISGLNDDLASTGSAKPVPRRSMPGVRIKALIQTSERFRQIERPGDQSLQKIDQTQRVV